MRYLIGVTMLMTAFMHASYLGATDKFTFVGSFERGKQLYQHNACSSCHGAKGQGSSSAPKIAPHPIRYDVFVKQLRQPRGVMPAYQVQSVSDQDLVDIYTYLLSIQASQAPKLIPLGSPERGKQLYLHNICYSCHGTGGQGSSVAPKIAPDPLPYDEFSRQLRKPRDVMPGYNVQFVSDQDLADIYAYLLSIHASPAPDDIPLLRNFKKLNKAP